MGYFKMGSSNRLLSRQRTVHQILGGGVVADVILWREKSVTFGILMLIVSVWLVFEGCGYTLLSLCSSVLLLLFSILHLWAKAASLLNRPPPPLPDLHLSEEMVSEMAIVIRYNVNTLLCIFQDIALGKDSTLFFKLAMSLLLISLISGLTDLVTLGYACLLILFVIPALYEKYEDRVDRCLTFVYSGTWRFYSWLNDYIEIVRNFELEKIKID